ncbi:MAG: hypothetical protein DRN08_04235 [Thermoplasmata archaeon]|nr:MAG: hypothetical protein DRN08_04235 [Thermoplasmata archaeon]
MIIFALSNKKERIAKNMVYLLILSSIYIIIRYIALIYIFLDTSRINIFWDPLVLTISFLPFSLLLMKFYSIQLENSTLTEPFKVFKINKNRVGILLLTFLFIFFSVGIKGYHDPGIIKDGRILIDEVHSEWEPTTRPMDKEWYGEISTYNYYCLAEWLDHIYSVEKNIDKNIDTSLLSNYDILIIKCPTKPFSQEEINAIVKFVHEGGGLWLIGDHTNVFGMNTYLNSISRKFGINFNYDSTNDLNTGFLSTYTTPKVLKHPILKGISSFDFMTSCSLKAPLLAEDVMIGYSLGALPGDYSDKDFFRKIPLNSDMKFGSFLQSVAVKYGKGKVAAFTDSTCLSSFSIFMDGNPGFVLGNIEYLNRSNKYVHSNEIFLFLAILTLLVLVFSIRKEKKSIALCLILISGSFSSSLAILTFTYLDELNYPGISDPYPNLPTVSFENEHSDVLFGSVGRDSYIHNEKQFDTFFIWTQRVGHYPSIDILEDSLKKDIVVIINLGKNFTSKEIKDIVNYVKNGGKILLMDSAFNTDSTANDLLLNFGLAIKRGVDKLNIGEDFAIGEPSISIIGEEPILSLNEDVVVAKKKIGDGMIVVMVDSYTFSDSVMGGCFTVPDEFQRKVYELEYFIFENVLADKNDTIEGLYKIGDEK